MKYLFKDRVSRIPRIWSNSELKKIAYFFSGDVVNVSAWNDLDKQGISYKDYFINAKKYDITNFNSEARGFQNIKGEIFLDLEKKLPKKLVRKYNVVFNHTTLEHIFKVEKAFENLCLLSKDIVIIVVPFLQCEHSDYGDYWRFTPQTVKRLFLENKLKLLYINYNDWKNTSIYIFAIASRYPQKWNKIIKVMGNKIFSRKQIGKNIIRNSIFIS